MQKIIILFALLFSTACFSQKFFCELDFDGAGVDTENFEFDSNRIEKKMIQHGKYNVEVKITQDDQEWTLELTVFDYKVRKESLYEVSTQYGVDSEEVPFHMFAEIYIRDTLNFLCNCQKI